MTGALRSLARHRLAVAIVASAGIYYAARATLVGPIVHTDTLRDLLAALDIARYGTSYDVGPVLALPGVSRTLNLGPLYYYFLALPLLVCRSAHAIPWWVAFWQTVTVLVLWNTAARLFSRRTALVATALFLLSDVCFSLYLPLGHADFSPLLGLLVFRSLARLQRERPWSLMGAFFWTSLALHFHALNASLFPVILALLFIARPPVAARHLLVAGAVALLPFLPTLGDRTRLADVAGAGSGVIPLAAVTLAAWRPPRPRTWWCAGLVAAGGLWLVLACALQVGAFNGHPAFRLFNFAIPLGLPEQAAFRASEDRNTWFLWYNLPALLLAAYGLSTCVRDFLGAARREAVRSPRFLLLLWAACTIPVGLLTCILRPEARYLAHAWVPVTLSAALGAEAAWNRYRLPWRGRVTTLNRRALWPAALLSIVTPVIWVVLAGWLPEARGLLNRRPRRMLAVAVATGLPLILAIRFSLVGIEAFEPSTYAGATRVLAALRAAGLGDDAIFWHVHGPLSRDSGFLDANSPVLFLLQLSMPNPQTRPPANDTTEYLLVSSPVEALPDVPNIDLGSRSLRAVPFQPALRAAEAQPRSPGFRPRHGSLLPYRSFRSLPLIFRGDRHEISAPDALWPSPLHLEIPRDVPSDPRLRGVEVMVSGSPDVSPPPCVVTLQEDGTPVPLHAQAGRAARRWRFVLPHRDHRVLLDLTVSGCRLYYLDVYDVYLS